MLHPRHGNVILAIVYPRQGLPLPQWPYSISVNSLIAVLTVIMKAAVLLVTAEGLSQLKWQWFRRERPLAHLVTYDKASRGPWGSLELMLELRHTPHRHLDWSICHCNGSSNRSGHTTDLALLQL